MKKKAKKTEKLRTFHTMTVHLDEETSGYLKQISLLAGQPVEAVITVMLACHAFAGLHHAKGKKR